MRLVRWTWEYLYEGEWKTASETLPEGQAKTFGSATEIRNVQGELVGDALDS